MGAVFHGTRVKLNNEQKAGNNSPITTRQLRHLVEEGTTKQKKSINICLI